MISIEAYRAAIGRFYGKAKKGEKRSTTVGNCVMTFSFLVIFLLIIFYGLLIEMMYTYHIYVPYLIMLLMTYSVSLVMIFVFSDSLSLIFQRNVNSKNVLMRKSVVDETLVQCRNVDTYVIDGRARQSNSDVKIYVENNQLSYM